jgi:hypothetical protein
MKEGARFILRVSNWYAKALVAHLIELISPSLKYLETISNTANLAPLSSVPTSALGVSVQHILGNNRFSRAYITPAHFKSLFNLSSLRHLTLYEFDLFEFQDPTIKGSIENDPARKTGVATSPVTSLSIHYADLYEGTLEYFRLVPLEVMRELFVLAARLAAWPRNLKCSHINISGKCSRLDALQESGLIRTLLSQKDSLEELFLGYKTLQPTILYSDGLNMVEFENLRILGLAETFLPFRQVDGQIFEGPLKHLWKLLPASLEDLQLEFTRPWEVDFCQAAHDYFIHGMMLSEHPLLDQLIYPEMFLASHETLDLRDWLYEILEHRKDHFPRLRFLVVWCGSAETSILPSRLRPRSKVYPDSPFPRDLASDYVGSWFHHFGLPVAFRKAGIRLGWSTDPEPPLFNPV